MGDRLRTGRLGNPPIVTTKPLTTRGHAVTEGRSAVELEDAWLSIGATEKAASVEHLTRGLSIASVLEVGCGTGAVLAEMMRRSIGSEYAGCEPSPELCARARSRGYGAPVDVRCGTLAETSLGPRGWDLVVVTHVLEHVDDPAALAVQALAAARYAVFEVPLEGTLMSRLRGWLRRALTGRPRTDNAAGHVQFFSAADVHRLVQWAGGRAIRTRVYLPAASYRQMATSATGWRRAYYRAWTAAAQLIGSRVLAHLYYGHFAVLATRRDVDEHATPHPFFWRPDER